MFKRRQFPIRPTFAMTINKSQGQTLESVGLYIPTPVFTHGQLYVALSRCTDEKNLKVLIIDGSIPGLEGTYTRNVVSLRVL
jgi:ATP-dependent exoDNAse (exonuclease V) alpha subunit